VDVASLATAVAGFLAPFLPYLRTAGEKVAEGALKNFGEDGYNKGKSVWARLGPKVGSQPRAAQALAELERNPQDSGALEAFTLQIESLLKADPKLAQEMNLLIGRDVSDSTIVVGEGNLAGRLDVSGGDFIHGNKVTYVHASSPSSSFTALHQLPPPPADFTGREEELAELIAKIKRGGIAISGVHGMGGIGKTALALVLADRLKVDYPDAQIYLDLKGTSETPLTVREILEQAILSFHPDSKLPEDGGQLANIYRSVLDRRRAILLMDNAAGSAQVAPLTPPSGSVLLITTRNRFNMPGLFQLDIGELPEDDARKLLLRIALRIGDHAGEVAELCGFLPLALRAAANLLAVTPSLGIDEYVGKLRDERTRLEAIGSTDIPVGVEASIGLSYGLLDEKAQRVFRQLAVFPGSFDKGAEEKICEDAGSKFLMELEQRSLVTYDERAARFKLHDLARLFGDERLPEDEREESRRRHAARYRDVLAWAHDLYLHGGERVGQGLKLFDSEWGNIRAGQTWAADQSDDDEVAASLCSDYPVAGVYLLDLRQNARQRIGWLESALATARRLNRRSAEGAHLGNMGIAYNLLGDYHRAIGYHEQSLTIFQEIRDRRGEGAVLGNLGIAYYSLGEYRRSIVYHQQHLAITGEIGDRRGEGAALGNLGIAYHALGEHQRAIENLEQYRHIASEIGYRRGEGIALGNLGLAHDSLGDYRRAIQYHQQYLAIAREIGDRHGEGKALGNLGTAYGSLGDYRRAIEYHEQRLAMACELGDRHGEGIALGDLGIAYHSLGENRRAIEYQQQNLAIAREIGDRYGEGAALHNMALALEDLGEYGNALTYAERALRIKEEIEDPSAPRVRVIADRLRGFVGPEVE
jgi:tetratricopeptide (TPR) repeat protein